MVIAQATAFSSGLAKVASGSRRSGVSSNLLLQGYDPIRTASGRVGVTRSDHAILGTPIRVEAAAAVDLVLMRPRTLHLLVEHGGARLLNIVGVVGEVLVIVDQEMWHVGSKVHRHLDHTLRGDLLATKLRQLGGEERIAGILLHLLADRRGGLMADRLAVLIREKRRISRDLGWYAWFLGQISLLRESRVPT